MVLRLAKCTNWPCVNIGKLQPKWSAQFFHWDRIEFPRKSLVSINCRNKPQTMCSLTRHTRSTDGQSAFITHYANTGSFLCVHYTKYSTICNVNGKWNRQKSFICKNKWMCVFFYEKKRKVSNIQNCSILQMYLTFDLHNILMHFQIVINWCKMCKLWL